MLLNEVMRALSPPEPFDRAEERMFLRLHAWRLALRRRIALGVTLFLWTMFLLFDFDLVPGSTPTEAEVFWQRGLGIVVLAGALVLALRPGFRSERYAERVVIGAGTAVYLCLLRMATILDFPLSWTYDFVGLLAWMFGFVGFFRLRANRVATILMIWALVGAAGLVYAEIEPMSGATPHAADAAAVWTRIASYPYAAALIYLALFVVIGALIARQLEQEARAAFAREVNLARTARKLRRAQAETALASSSLLATREALRLAAEQANREKSRFLAASAHDLGQLLHAVSLSIEAARLASEHGAPPATNAIEQAARSIRTTREAFRRVLEVSELDSGLIRPEIADVPLAPLLEEIVAATRVVAENRGATLTLDLACAFDARTDRPLLSRALLNLVSNAIRYGDPTKPHRQVTVTAAYSAADGFGRIIVADNGIGMEAARIADAFRPFVQLHPLKGGEDAGLGLGLSVVKAVIDLLADHAIEIASEPGMGTTATLSLPRAERAA